nr:TVP38/TMEM64 family protein [Citreimonas salinaria]
MMRRSLIGLAVLVAIGVGAWALWGPPGLAAEVDRETLDGLVEAAGAAGPSVIVAFMTVAVVASPIPSAPIAMASGAAYGHFWGTLWVILGAETGALIAFGLARGLGRGVMKRWFGDRIEQGLLGSQNALTAAVFASRLMPFVSFDLISYAAGLSTLKFWRFALATLAGIAPASFLLAHFGTAAASGEAGAFTWAAALGLGLVTGAPLVWAAWRGRGRKPR